MVTLSLTLLAIFSAATLVNLGYLTFIFSRLAYHQSSQSTLRPKTEKSITNQPGQPNISLIICARNEIENLRRHLDRYLNQSYHSFELVVVDDHSSDGTAAFLASFQKSNPTFRIRILTNGDKVHQGKKDALRKGIEAAKGEWVLLTDADCCPDSENWIQSMVQRIAPGREIILGYSPYRSEAGMLNRFIRFEAVFTAVQYLSFALAGVPYMGVGRNLMYRRDLFLSSDRFQSHLDIASGDDDLFVSAVAHRSNTAIALEPETFVTTTPAKTWREYIRQKRRHLTASSRYKLKTKALLGAWSASHFVHYWAATVLLVLNFSTVFVLALFALRLSVAWLMYGSILKKLRDRSLWVWFPVLDVMYTIYYLVFAPGLLIRKKAEWN
jgi:glycosyltransferase involved in cell wall biosynthesis